MVAALARSPARADELAKQGLSPVSGELGDIWSLRRLDVAEKLIYYLAPPSTGGTNDTWMRNFLTALPADRPPARCILVSTTGVYGDHRGEWVDEESELRPATDRARRRLDAERVLRTWGRVRRVPVVVLRVPGIYGPGRLPLARLRAGKPVVQEQECPYTNRIHVDDLVQACIAAADHGLADNIYNICDGAPGTMTEYFNTVADVFGLPRPPVVTMEQARTQLTPGLLSYMSESRRLRNDKMLGELGVRLRYPDLMAALRAMQKKSG
jgi:nucleoside-diphosphate-sugar epimerase